MEMGTLDVLKNEFSNIDRRIQEIERISLKDDIQPPQLKRLKVYRRKLKNRITLIENHSVQVKPLVRDRFGMFIL